MHNYNLAPSRLHRLAKTLLRIHGHSVLMQGDYYYEMLCQHFTDAADRWIAAFTDPIERACAQNLAKGYDDYIDDKRGATSTTIWPRNHAGSSTSQNHQLANRLAEACKRPFRLQAAWRARRPSPHTR